MFLHRFHEELDTGNGYVSQPFCQRSTFFGGDASSTPIADVSIGINRAPIAACSHILRCEFEANTYRFEGSATDQVFHRVIAEEPQVTRPASRSDSWGNGVGKTLYSLDGESIQVRSLCSFQLRLSARCDRQSSQTVGYEHDDL